MRQDYTVVVLGAGGVGKTSMISQFIRGHFPRDCKTTLEDCYRHIIRLPDGMYRNVDILDTAGSHQFPAMRELSIQLGQAFVLVFSINDEDSYEEAKRLGEHIIDIKGREVPLVLVGNKSDLIDEREVSSIDAAEFARNTFCSTYVETSAKHNANIYQLFQEAIFQSLNNKKNGWLGNRASVRSLKAEDRYLLPLNSEEERNKRRLSAYVVRRELQTRSLEKPCVIL